MTGEPQSGELNHGSVVIEARKLSCIAYFTQYEFHEE